jgi:bifunctional non-homologous end joining protein LigD
MAKPTFPDFVPPMMAESTKAPFDSQDWIFKIKLDGYRAITVFDSAGKAHLWSRNGLSLEAKFPAIANAVSKLKLRSTILDGEVVAVDENGIPRFQLLQRFQKQPTAPTLYYVFDLLWYKGDDLTQKPVLERRKVLEQVLKPAAGIQLGSYVEAEGKALFELTKEKGMEGIIAKRKDSLYRPGKRASDWLKIKARLQQEFVIGGFTAPKGSRKHLGAVVLGAYTIEACKQALGPARPVLYGYNSPEELIAALTDISRQLYVKPGRRTEFLKHGVRLVNLYS